MDPNDPTYNVSQRRAQAAGAANRNDGDARMDRNLRRQLDAEPDQPVRNVRARRRGALLANPGGPNIFAEAALLPVPRPVTTNRAAGPVSNVLVSVSDNLIGSVYLPGGRVRTTHYAGPAVSQGDPASILRFNIDRNAAIAAFRDANPAIVGQITAVNDQNLSREQRIARARDAYVDSWLAWMAEELRNDREHPDWAHPVTGPESVASIADARSDSGRVLFEVFDRGPDQSPGTHISRGEMVWMPMEQQTLDAIFAAIEQLDPGASPEQQNERFYNYLGSNAPDFARRIRRP